MPILIAEDITNKINNGDILKIDFSTGEITNKTQNKTIEAKAFSKSQLDIYKRGGLLS